MFKKILITISVLLMLSSVFLSANSSDTDTPQVVINEIAWSGTKASHFDEWIELKNNSDKEINLTGWTLSWNIDSKKPTVIEFPKPSEEQDPETISPGDFYLLERTDDNTISNIKADFIYTGSLNNNGESIVLKNSKGVIVDTANRDGGEWPGGTSSNQEPFYASLERIDSTELDNDRNWGTNNGISVNGKDVDGNPLNGTPGSENSQS